MTLNIVQVCAALREELDEQNKKRMESFEIKMKPIIIKDGPSRKVVLILIARLSKKIFTIK